MLNGVGTNISMAYTSNYNKKSTGDKMNIEFEIGNGEQNSINSKRSIGGTLVDLPIFLDN